MNILKLTVLCAALVLSGVAGAKGGSSSGGGHSSSGGGHSSSSGGHSSSMSSGSSARANSAPSIAPTSRPNSAPVISPNSRPNSAPSIAPNAPRTTSTTTTSTTTSRSYSRNVNYGGGMAYGGWGMGYGYSNGIMTGLLIGSMMHPYGSTMYMGGGMYNNNALLYPDGRVVNQQGYQVGMYQNGQFTNVRNGAMVAQTAPADAYSSSQPQPVVIVNAGPTIGETIMGVLVGLAVIFLIVILFT